MGEFEKLKPDAEQTSVVDAVFFIIYLFFFFFWLTQQI